MSSRETEKEQHHIKNAEQLGHLRVPIDEQKSEWSTRTRRFQKGEPASVKFHEPQIFESFYTSFPELPLHRSFSC